METRDWRLEDSEEKLQNRARTGGNIELDYRPENILHQKKTVYTPIYSRYSNCAMDGLIPSSLALNLPPTIPNYIKFKVSRNSY